MREASHENRHMRTIGIILSTAALAASLAGCSISRTVALEDETSDLTASVAEPMKAEGIDSTDAELIKSVVAGTDDLEQSNALAWSNPDTGNRGTIVAINRFVGDEGNKCKKFETTVDSFMGISLYDGETCELKPGGAWVLSRLRRK